MTGDEEDTVTAEDGSMETDGEPGQKMLWQHGRAGEECCRATFVRDSMGLLGRAQRERERKRQSTYEKHTAEGSLASDEVTS